MSDLQYDVGARDAQNDALARSIGPSPVLQILAGERPAAPGDPLAGQVVIAEGALPEAPFRPSENAVLSKAGIWRVVGQRGAGSGAKGDFFRLCDADGRCRVMGSFGDTSSGALMRAKNNRIAAGQEVEVEGFAIVRGNG